MRSLNSVMFCLSNFLFSDVPVNERDGGLKCSTSIVPSVCKEYHKKPLIKLGATRLNADIKIFA